MAGHREWFCMELNPAGFPFPSSPTEASSLKVNGSSFSRALHLLSWMTPNYNECHILPDTQSYGRNFLSVFIIAVILSLSLLEGLDWVSSDPH